MLARIIRLQSSVYWAGIILLLISTAVLIISPAKSNDDTGYFIINYILTGLYFFILLFHKSRLAPASKIFHWIILFALLLVSAWALNRSIPVFESSVTWITTLQVMVCIALVVSAFFRFLPIQVNHICAGIFGFGLPLFMYLSLYVLPLYFLSILAAIGLGISLHSFAPVLITIATIVLIVKMIRSRKSYLYSFLTGLAVSVIITAFFCTRWAITVNSINKEYHRVLANENSDIPLWMQLAQRIPQDDYTRKILKTGIVYVQADVKSMNFFWNTPSKRFDESKKHDPLITFASLFAHLEIGDDDKIKILESSFDSHHETQERLWSGDHLITQHVFTHVQIWPALQLAYTEKTITVKNTNPENRWPQSEEAIYTFYLPEGSVVSSLSLWINGIEEKGILTTKEKAAEAYKTIVQVQRRDPSVIHWQEGNTVTVRVFPVMAGNNRIFKIGITSPLVKKGGDVFFQNAWFKGPSFSNATEIIHTTLNSDPGNLTMPGFFAKKDAKQYEYEGEYKNYWQVDFPAQDVKNSNFIFQGKSYTLQRYEKQSQVKSFNKYFIDINSAWTRPEFEEIMSVLKNKEVFFNYNGIVKLNSSTINELYETLHKEKFSLFPLYKISDPENSLLITKGGEGSPNMADLSGSPFLSKLNTFIKAGKKLNVVDIGDNLPPYLKTLREYRALQYEKTTVEDFKKEINDNIFPVNQESNDLIVLNEAELVIKKSDASNDNKAYAPDHLLRLFAYNDIMRQVKQFPDDSVSATGNIIKEAELAHIVSPVSSLIVLETQADYDRFNIHDSKEGLQNASHKMAGAVPEPHEWVLIILAALLFLYLLYSSKFRKASC